MSKNNGKNIEIQDFEYPQKNEQTCMQLLYNKEQGTYLGRTPKNWVQLGLFYLIFYIVLASMFAICFQGLFASLSDTEPTWKLDRSLIGTNPGLGFRPLSEETERGSVIQFSLNKSLEREYWKDLIDDFLKPYNAAQKTGNINSTFKTCDFNQAHNKDQVCAVDMDAFGPCSAAHGYGYDNGRPCIFLKLNKIFGWEPQYYDDVNDLDKDMPESLRYYIQHTQESRRQQVWVSCNGTNSPDQESMGPISYYPSQGFPSYYYPYLNQNNYLSPLIAVQFERLNTSTIVNVECRAWAKNIIYSGSLRDRKGSVTFQFVIDKTN